ncbi:nitrous oxide reductase family maturation protein NosD [Paracoccus jiaweipingae]|uniref:nitrous oxide reductase family maturation protein NosD n=1 Tax=unclassified Paracoccus (in: a-proteobacteria) TaxID=2688777 RepID=UPI00379AC0B7
MSSLPALFLSALGLLLAVACPSAGAVVPVSAGQDLAAAIADAAPGDQMVLAPGDYAGPIVIDRPLTLTGHGKARITGPGAGSVIRVQSGGVVLDGLVVTGSGLRLDKLDSGIVLDRDHRDILVQNCTLLDNLIGIDVQGARDVTLRGNTIRGRDDLRVPERGPGVYVWNAPGLLAEGNDISRGRDGFFVTTSHRATYRRNRFHDLRYAFHSMYANRLVVEDNLSTGNEIGYALMFSQDLKVSRNVSDGDRAHAFFMNFANKAVLTENRVTNGPEKCLFVYNANRNRFVDNLFSGCDIGVHYTAGAQDNLFTGNSFVGNRTQVKYVGTKWIEFSEGRRGNYWSDHPGFDIDGDGVADSPYRPNDVIDQVVWNQPAARLLLGAPAVQLIRWSQSRFPGLMPGGVIDSHPLARPGVPVQPVEKGGQT